MTDTYKGESWGKRRARDAFWSTVIGHHRERGALGQFGYLILASREGGDVSTLLGHGVPVECILAVERNAEAFDAFRKKWPEVHCEFGDVADVAKKFGPQIGGALLDFCSELTPEVLRTSIDVMNAIALNAALGVAILRGREKNSAAHHGVTGMPNRGLKRAHYSSRKKRPMLQKLSIEAAYGEFDGRKLIDAAKRAYPGVYDDSRGMALFAAIDGAGFGRIVRPNVVINYHSRTEDSGGVPMSIALGAVIDRGLGWVKDRHWDVVNIGSLTEDDIRKLVLAGEFGDEPHLRLNVSKGTIAAWRAHETRGTYEGDEP